MPSQAYPTPISTARPFSSSQHRSRTRCSPTHQVLDLHALYRPITKASIKLDAGNVLSAAQYALHLVQSERPGPVHLQLSNEDAGEPVAENPPPAVKPPQPAASTTTAAAIDRARSILARAHRPLILAGLGLEPERPYAALPNRRRRRLPSHPRPKAPMPAMAPPLWHGRPHPTDPIYTLIDGRTPDRRRFRRRRTRRRGSIPRRDLGGDLAESRSVISAAVEMSAACTIRSLRSPRDRLTPRRIGVRRV